MWVSIIYFPSYTGQNFWGTINSLHFQRSHLWPKIRRQKNSFNPISRKYGAIKIEVHAKVFNAPGITSVEQKFPNMKLFQSYVHTLPSPTLLLLHLHIISEQPIKHNSKSWTTIITTVMMIMTMVVVEMCMKLMSSALCAELVVLFVEVYDKLLHISIMYTFQLLPVHQYHQ